MLRGGEQRQPYFSHLFPRSTFTSGWFEIGPLFICLVQVAILHSQCDARMKNKAYLIFSPPSINPPKCVSNSSFCTDLWLWPGESGGAGRVASHDTGGGHTILQSAGDPDGEQALFQRHRHLVCGLHLCRAAWPSYLVPGPESHPTGIYMCWCTVLQCSVFVFLDHSTNQSHVMLGEWLRTWREFLLTNQSHLKVGLNSISENHILV